LTVVVTRGVLAILVVPTVPASDGLAVTRESNASGEPPDVRHYTELPIRPGWRNTGLRPDEARCLEFRDVTVVEDDATGETILEIEVRGKRGVGYCKSMSGAVRPFERLRERLRPPRGYDEPKNEDGSSNEAPVSTEWRLPTLTDLIFPKWQRELFRTILDEENLRSDREGRPRTAYSLRHRIFACG
jgi:hypothetical protein